MAVETVLMYNCNGEQWAKLRQIFLMLPGGGGILRPHAGVLQSPP